MRLYRLNPNRTKKLFERYRDELGRRVRKLDGKKIHPRLVPYLVDEDEEIVLETQSGTEFSLDYAPTEMSSTNVSFSDENAANMYTVDPAQDETRTKEDTPDVGLAEFFRRPVKIAEYEWGTGTVLAESFNPWSRFFEDSRVLNRITTFNLMRANLHLRVLLNGNGFQYGRAILSYNPLDAEDDFAPSLLIEEDLVQLSQLPHIYLNPTTSQGGDMHLPFFYHYNNLRNTEYSQLGACYLKSINALKHANGATDKVTITVFAWAEDVTLAVPTSLDNTNLIPQSGEVDEANDTGIVSGPATAIAEAASTLSNVPVIGPYARATEMPARMIAAMAKAMGYCRPTVTKNPEPFRNVAISSLAVTNVPDGAHKLTIDDKQELTIDPAISGISCGDVLEIKSIAGRESYITKFTWAVGSAPDTLLWNTRVSPMTWAEVGTPLSIHLPACAMASLPFKYWTGTMKYRFQVVCSNYHKGRLRIAYDPNFFDTTAEYNVNYNHIVDIADNTDFTISVKNGQQYTLIDRANPGRDSATEVYSSTRYTNRQPGNGVLQVSVLNELTVPNSVVNNDIEINVFVSAGDDFEVFVPGDDHQYFVLEPQSGELAMDKTDMDSKPMNDGEDNTDLNGQSNLSDKTNLVFTGESIKSFRTMLKRYTYHSSYCPRSTGFNSFRILQSMFPYLRGNVAGAVHTTSALASYNYCNTVMLHWIMVAFSGWRGSIRWKYLPKGGWVDYSAYCSRLPVDSSIDQFNSGSVFVSAPVNDSQAAFNAVAIFGSNPQNDQVYTGALGQTFAINEVNPCLEVEVPFYSQARFVPGRREDWTDNFGDFFTERVAFNAFGAPKRTAASIDTFCAAGEDFQVYFFKGMPRLYYENAPPAPDAT